MPSDIKSEIKPSIETQQGLPNVNVLRDLRDFLEQGESSNAEQTSDLRGIKRERIDSPLFGAPREVKRERTGSPLSDARDIKQEPVDSPERLASADAPASNRAPATFNDTHTRLYHENRTFYFKHALDFFKVTEYNTARIYATDNPVRLRQEIGDHHTWERVNPPDSLSHEQCKLYTPLHVLQRAGDALHLFSDPKVIANAYPRGLLKPTSLLSVAEGSGVWHKAFMGSDESQREALRTDGVPLIHQDIKNEDDV
jgi:hypothetical protein